MSFHLTKTQLINYFKNHPLLPVPSSRDEQKLIPAAVLIPIIDAPAELLVLFTERTKHLKNHAGQISFPGGRLEKNDDTLRTTALRETREEIGLLAEQIEIIGQLPPVTSIAGFFVTPFVGLIKPPLTLNLDPSEVAATFTAPLDFLLDPRNQQQQTILFEGQNKTIFVIKYENYCIWGMTAKIIVELGREITLSHKGRE